VGFFLPVAPGRCSNGRNRRLEDIPLKDVWHLQSVDWQKELTPEERDQLRASSVRRQYETGEIVFTPVPTPESLYLLEEGLIRIYRLSESGMETALGYVRSGEVFGELAVFGDFPRESFAQAVKRSTAWKIPRRAFLPFVTSRPGLGFAISKQIGQRLKRIESRVENLVFRDVHTRIMLILCELAETFGSEHPDGSVEIDVPLTQSELATLVGSTRQSVNSSLGELTEQGFLTKRGRHVVVTKLEELKRAARPTA
jgi:CRP/FNR family cyclic AMP-dependent transcriptional regulator